MLGLERNSEQGAVVLRPGARAGGGEGGVGLGIAHLHREVAADGPDADRERLGGVDGQALGVAAGQAAAGLGPEDAALLVQRHDGALVDAHQPLDLLQDAVEHHLRIQGGDHRGAGLEQGGEFLETGLDGLLHAVQAADQMPDLVVPPGQVGQGVFLGAAALLFDPDRLAESRQALQRPDDLLGEGEPEEQADDQEHPGGEQGGAMGGPRRGKGDGGGAADHHPPAGAGHGGVAEELFLLPRRLQADAARPSAEHGLRDRSRRLGRAAEQHRRRGVGDHLPGRIQDQDVQPCLAIRCLGDAAQGVTERLELDVGGDQPQEATFRVPQGHDGRSHCLLGGG